MLRALLYIFIVFDGIAVAAVNLALAGSHLSSHARAQLYRFNTVVLIALALAIAAMFVFHFTSTPSRQTSSRWPQEPPD